jgi:hypothetical protein
MSTIEFIMQIGPHIVVLIGSIVYFRVRPPRYRSGIRVVKDRRLGKLGEHCIWCAHPGAMCSHKPRHFDTPTKSCYEYGCTDDCPVARCA